MKQIIFVFMIFLFHCAIANAQDLFRYERIDFFGKTQAREEPVQIEPKQFSQIITDEWAEPVISPSGNVSVYMPSKEVRDFLEKPDSENAKAYLEWNLRRINKLILAQELLAKEAKELEGMKKSKRRIKPHSSLSLKSFNGRNSGGAGYLFYFMLKGCPVCESEAQVIEDIYLNHPEIRIEVFGKGFSDIELDGFRFLAYQDKGMSALFKIDSYPSIAVFNRKNKKYILSGFIDKENILRMFE